MKRFFLLFFFTAVFFQGYSQICPVCIIDLTCDSVPAAPKLCPYELPEDTAGQYYSADMTFYIPQQFQDPQYGTVNLDKIEVLGVTGLPAGMSWKAYDYTGAAATTFFPPANPPASERGCAKICGTPPMPFDDSISVTVIAYVTVSGVSASQNSTFKVHLKIVPNPSGNSVFTMDNSQGCDSVSVNFTPNLQSNGNPMITYSWDFGNGQTSTAEFPSETYLTPGDYTVNCTTKVYHYVVTSASVNALSSNWCGDVEEISCTFNNPDVFLQVNSNGGITTSDTIWNSKTPSWSNLNYPIEGNQFILYFYDADDGPPLGSVSDSLGYTTITASGSGGTYNFNTTGSPFPGTTGSITVAKQVKETYVDSDFIHVYGPPVLNPLTMENDSICNGDSVLLVADGGYAYQWYNDTILLFGANDSAYLTKVVGNYWVAVTNSYGCTANSNIQHITVVPKPPKPNFIFMGNNTLKTFVVGYSLQWLFNGNPIPGATSQTLIIDSSGYYQLFATNGFCNNISDSVFYNFVGLEPHSALNSLAVFPNPNKGEFTVRFKADLPGDVEISVTDMVGRVVFSEIHKEVGGDFSKDIDLSSAGTGVYFLRFSAGGLTANRKIVVSM